MRVPLGMAVQLGAYIAKNKLWPKPEWQRDPDPPRPGALPILGQPAAAKTSGSTVPPHPMLRKRFPLVLMLEPLHACNLTCTGCGRIREYESTITERIPLEKCLSAVEECGAPIVSICGGEPMMYPRIGELVEGYLWLASGIFISARMECISSRRLRPVQAEPALFLQRSSRRAARKRTTWRSSATVSSKKRLRGFRQRKRPGFMVCTNTTVYRETDMNEIEALFEHLQQFDVDGHMLSPAYGYSAVNTREIFLTRDEVHEKFKDVDRLFSRSFG